MGSWAELDAIYPPGVLTPATVFVVAFGHLAGATSVYANQKSGRPADFLPRPGPGYDADLLERAEYFLRDVPIEQFVVQAGRLLNPRQKICLLLNLQERATHPHHAAWLDQLAAGFNITSDLIDPAMLAMIKNDLSVFPQ